MHTLQYRGVRVVHASRKIAVQRAAASSALVLTALALSVRSVTIWRRVRQSVVKIACAVLPIDLVIIVPMVYAAIGAYLLFVE